MMSLWELIKKRECSTVAVCGMAKNTGKTVTLNYLVKSAGKKGMDLGLTSIGRDGEMWDVLSYKRKPPIYVKPGMLLATAEKTLRAATAKLKVLQLTELETPLGRVAIARAETAGRVELAGPSRVAQLLEVINALKAFGIQLVLVDGTFDRQSFAAPRVTEGFILATGGILSESLQEVVKITRHCVDRLLLPKTSDEIIEYYRQGYVVVLSVKGHKAYPGSIMRGQKNEFWRSLNESISHIIFGGALLTPTLLDVMDSEIDIKGMRVVVRDATCLFVDKKMIDKFTERGGRIEVLEPMDLLAVTVNPTSPEGRDFESKVFYDAMSQSLKDVPVFDLVQGYGP